MPDKYFKGFSETQAKEGLKNLPNLENDKLIRKKTTEIYTDFLIMNNKNHASKKWFPNHSFLTYPLLVKNREKVFADAGQNNILLGDWFCSPLHPVKDSLAKWNFKHEIFPTASYLSSHVVNLHTTPTNTNKVIGFLSKNIDQIIDQG